MNSTVIAYFRCNCEKCTDTFPGGAKVIEDYDCETQCDQCDACGGNFVDNSIEPCNLYCKDGEGWCRQLCNLGKRWCTSCIEECNL